MIVEFLGDISMQEQKAIKDWLENNKLQSCQIVKINGVDYNFIVVFLLVFEENIISLQTEN